MAEAKSDKSKLAIFPPTLLSVDWILSISKPYLTISGSQPAIHFHTAVQSLPLVEFCTGIRPLDSKNHADAGSLFEFHVSCMCVIQALPSTLMTSIPSSRLKSSGASHTLQVNQFRQCCQPLYESHQCQRCSKLVFPYFLWSL